MSTDCDEYVAMTIALSRANGALADAGTVPTDDIERGIRMLTEERDRWKLEAQLWRGDTEAVLPVGWIHEGPGISLNGRHRIWPQLPYNRRKLCLRVEGSGAPTQYHDTWHEAMQAAEQAAQERGK